MKGTTRALVVIAILLALLAIAVADSLLAFQIMYEDKIVPGVYVGDLPLGGMSVDQAESAIEKAFTPFPAPPIQLRAGKLTWGVYPNSLGVHVLAAKMAKKAFEYGHRGTWLQQIEERIRIYRAKVNIPVEYEFDDGATDYFLDHVATQVDSYARPPQVKIQGTQVIVEPGKPGYTMDIEATRKKLYEAFRAHTPSVDAVMIRQEPFKADLDISQKSAEKLLRSDLVFTATTSVTNTAIANVLVIEKKELAKMIDWGIQRDGGKVAWIASLNKGSIAEKVTSIAAELKTDPVDALLDFDEGSKQVVVLSPSIPGREVDVQATVDKALESIDKGIFKVPVVFRIIKPKVDEHDIPNMGIKEVIGEATTYFKGSRPGRIKNIVVSASKFKGLVIPPGEVFSFNQRIGPIDKEHGFEESMVIKGDRTAVGIGGGVCQVSTTMFQAAFWAGLPILERWAHGYIVLWYGKPGLDATIFTPNVDLKFQNNTGHYLLIKPIVDLKRNSITIKLYGTNPGWTVKLVERRVENIQSPPPPKCVENPKLPPGTIKQVEWPVKGETVTVVREVYKDGKVISHDEFVSNYVPWRAVYEYGPGTTNPCKKGNK
jgi:vancomycin resistance protein YoaR